MSNGLNIVGQHRLGDQHRRSPELAQSGASRDALLERYPACNNPRRPSYDIHKEAHGIRMPRGTFDALYREHYPRVFGLCRRALSTQGEAEDAAQDVFARGYRAFASYDEAQPFARWIMKIAVNHCIDLLRRRARWAAVFKEGAAAADVPDAAENCAGPLIAAQRAEAVARAVDALPDKLRIPIVLAYYAETSYDDIAATLGITRNHVGVLLWRGKTQLRRTLAGFEEENLT
jgi:RNA polymerase sigma-70 factor (ECF subfamily)